MFRRKPPRTPPPPLPPAPPAPAEEPCPRCGAPIYEGEKDTSSGRDLRMVYCTAHCGWMDTRDVGIALWKAMSEAKE